MSGGVDSSVAAALLKEQGYFVVGGFMKNFSAESWEGVLDADCPWEKDLEDVQKVCQQLGIEWRSFNFEKEYEDKVIEYFFTEYAAGRTPNPDVMCNKEIKFGLFQEEAMKLGFDYIATGHYARIRSHVPPLDGEGKGGVKYELLKGLDPKKDQSYFLYALNQGQLAKTLFPVGEYQKPEVRALARKFGLPNASKKDSQGVCFVGHIKLREFLRQRIPEKVGEIVDSSGRVIGHHPGAWYFTIGQRHGLGIGGGTPYYVIQKDVVSNKLFVDKGPTAPKVYKNTAFVTNLHWVGEPPTLPLKCQAKIRYRQEDQRCELVEDTEGYEVKFNDSQFALAPGQALVLYDKDRVLGGAIIEN